MQDLKLEVISPNVKISDDYIDSTIEYQTSHVKKLENGKVQVKLSYKWFQNLHIIDLEISIGNIM